MAEKVLFVVHKSVLEERLKTARNTKDQLNDELYLIESESKNFDRVVYFEKPTYEPETTDTPSFTWDEVADDLIGCKVSIAGASRGYCPDTVRDRLKEREIDVIYREDLVFY